MSRHRNMKKKERTTFVTLFPVLVLTAILACSNGKDGCRDLEYLKCIENKTFIGHVIKTINLAAPGLEECQMRCFPVRDCVSYNLGPVNGNRRTCELSSSDHWTFPDALKEIAGHEYCPIKNRCSSKPCSTAKPLCYPDFAWDDHTCRDGVWGQWGPWSFCTCPLHAFRTRVCQSNSGGQALDCGPGPSRETSACPRPEDSQQCSKALGMEDKCIPDNNITASSSHSSVCSPHYGRLHRNYSSPNIHDSSWCAQERRTEDYLQVNLGSTKTVTKIATQGRDIKDKARQFVTKYSIEYSIDGSTWENFGNPLKIFQGNTDVNSVVTNELSPPITAQHIRVIVKAYHEHPSMRIELYGC